MLVVDFLILNRDRHGANIEVLRNSKNKTLRLAPLFDHGLSLLFSCFDEAAVNAYDVTDDKAVQCFVGSRSAKDNLLLIPRDQMPNINPLKESDREALLGDLSDVLGRVWLERIWEMIWTRWRYYEDFCHKRRV